MASCYTLSKMIADKAFAMVTPNGTALSVTLKEESSEDKYDFVINGLPDGIEVIKGDAYFAVCLEHPGGVSQSVSEFKGTSFFKHGTHTGKRCDYIIIDWKNEFITFIEMKKTTAKAEAVKQQFVGAEAVLDYIRRVGACYFKRDYEDFLGKNFKHHYVRVGYLDMKGKKHGKNLFDGNGTLDKPLKISHRRDIYYKLLMEAIVDARKRLGS